MTTSLHPLCLKLHLLAFLVFWLTDGVLPKAQPGEYHQGQSKTRVIRTKYGLLQGFVTRVGRDAEQQRHVEVYLGVPYASSPTGNYRFSPTRPPVHWSGVRTALSHGPVCPQQSLPDISNETDALRRMPESRLKYFQSVLPSLAPERQSEDCLHMNIYVPIEGDGGGGGGSTTPPPEANDPDSSASSSSGRRFPVMIFVHGESFSWGSGNLFDGRVLASYGRVIVVTFNFRLGIFGFLNTNVSPDRKPSMANYGLMDQIAALKWVQENVGQFGGDPGAVTLFGHQTGAALIQLLMQSPVVVPGLFHRAIMMSGSAFSSWALVDDPVHYAVKLAASLNCTIPRNMMLEHEEIVKCLRTKSVSALTSFDFGTPSFLTSMGPSRDGILIPADTGVQEEEDEQGHHKRRAQQTATYQVMLGLSEDEGDAFFSDSETREGLGQSTRDRYLRTLVRNNYNFHLNEIFATVQNEYSDWLTDEEVVRPRRLQWEASRAITDKLYLAPILQSANWCGRSGFPVYLYVFAFVEEEEEQQHLISAAPGSSRDAAAAEAAPPRSRRDSLLPLVFGLPFAPELRRQPQWAATRSVSGRGAAVAQKIITYWTNFARSGDPTGPNGVHSLFPRYASAMAASGSAAAATGAALAAGGVGSLVWEPYDSNSQKFLHLDSTPRMRHHFRLHAMSVWLHLLPKLHSAGSNNIFPQHNAFLGHDDPALFSGVVRPNSFSHGYQVNREFFDATSPSPPAATTCVPVNSRGQMIVSSASAAADDGNSLVRWEKASEHAYKQAMYLTIGLGTLLLAANVWFLLCLFFCRSRISCCAGLEERASNRASGLGSKEYTCETEIAGIADGSMQSFRELQGSSRHNSNSRSQPTSRSGSLSRSQAAAQETMRLLQQHEQQHLALTDSDRDSRSTSSQSGSQQCGGAHRLRLGQQQQQQQQAFTISGTEVQALKEYEEQQQRVARTVHCHSSTLPSQRLGNNRSASLQLHPPPPSKDESAYITTTLGKKIPHTLGSNCRLNELSSDTNRRFQEAASSPNGSTSTASSQGISIILPPPPLPSKELLLSSALKRYPPSDTSSSAASAGSSKPSKMTTFALIAPIDEDQQLLQQQNGGRHQQSVVSFGGETIMQ